MQNTRITRILAVSLFVAAMGASPVVFGQAISQADDTDDTTVATSVRAAFIADPNLQSTLMHVEADEGAIQLRGVVRNKTQEDEAVKVASQVGGVKSVSDHLDVMNQ